MDNDEDFAARANPSAEEPDALLPDDSTIVDNFVLCGLKRRAGILQGLDAELCGEVDSSPNSLRRRLRLMEFRRTMRGVHEALRKARR